MSNSNMRAHLKLSSAPTRLRQIALVTQDLEQAKQLLTGVLGTQVVYEDPAVTQWGLRNFLLPLGGDFIEVVAPFQSDTTASRLLNKRGPGGYMIIMQTEGARKRREQIRAQHLAKVIFTHELSDSVCIQYHPKGIKGTLHFLLRLRETFVIQLQWLIVAIRRRNT